MDPLHIAERGVFLGKHSERLVVRKGKNGAMEIRREPMIRKMRRVPIQICVSRAAKSQE